MGRFVDGDTGVAFFTVHDPASGNTATVLSNVTTGADPIERLLQERVRMSDQIVLGVDVGGSHIKALLSTKGSERRRFDSSPHLTAQQMVDGVAEITSDWSSISCRSGFPQPSATVASSPSR